MHASLSAVGKIRIVQDDEVKIVFWLEYPPGAWIQGVCKSSPINEPTNGLINFPHATSSPRAHVLVRHFVRKVSCMRTWLLYALKHGNAKSSSPCCFLPFTFILEPLLFERVSTKFISLRCLCRGSYYFNIFNPLRTNPSCILNTSWSLELVMFFAVVCTFNTLKMTKSIRMRVKLSTCNPMPHSLQISKTNTVEFCAHHRLTEISTMVLQPPFYRRTYLDSHTYAGTG